MSEMQDPLEQELAALQPHEPSLELKQRIGGNLAAKEYRTRCRLVVLVTAGMVAASIGLVILFARVKPSSNKRHSLSQPVMASEVRHVLPTLQVYQQALNESPEALDALLADHAALDSMAGSHGGNIGVLSRPDSNLLNLTGDF